jgi:hypothetical protein
MKKLNVIQAQSMKVVQANGTYGHLPDAVEAVEEHFEFKGLPKDDEIVEAGKPVEPNAQAKPLTFTQGKVTVEGRTIAIDSFQIYPAGLLVSTRTDTDDSDKVVLHAMDWASKTFAIKYDELKPSFGHFSTLDFRFDRCLPELFPFLQRMTELFGNKLEPFWESRPKYELTGLTFFYDKGAHPAFAPGVFRIDRRAGQPFQRNIYWSEAPLSTSNHVQLLAEFEELCA